jgi:hypothetical protein
MPSLIASVLIVILILCPGQLVFAQEATRGADQRGVLVLPGQSEGTFKTLYDKRYAVVVGINKYPKAASRFQALRGAVNDANQVEASLKKMGFDEVIGLRDEQATKSAIIEALGDQVSSKAKDNDLVVFFFAGHGDTRGEGTDQMGFILPHDYDPNRHMTTALSMSTLHDISKGIKAKHMLYAMDSCFAGGILTSRAGAATIAGKGTLKYLRNLTQSRAHVVITAGGQNEFANEEGGQGLFTKVLLEGLSGKADRSQKGFVTASSLALYIQETLPDYLPSGVRQTPQYGRLLGEGDIVITMLRPFDEEERAAAANRAEIEQALKKKLEQEFHDRQTRERTELDRQLKQASTEQRKQIEDEFQERQARLKLEMEKNIAAERERLAREREQVRQELEKSTLDQRKKLEQEFQERQAREAEKAKKELEQASSDQRKKMERELQERLARERADYERHVADERARLTQEREQARQELEQAAEERKKAEEARQRAEEQQPPKKKHRAFMAPSF